MKKIVILIIIILIYVTSIIYAVQDIQHEDPFSSLKPYLIGINVPNEEEAAQWYQKNLGFEIFERTEFPDHGIKIIFLRSNDFILEISKIPGSVSIQEIIPDLKDLSLIQGFVKLSFTVNDLETALLKLKTNRVNIIKDITTVKITKEKFILFNDINGNLLQFISDKDTKVENPMSSLKPRIIGLQVPNVELTVQWYKQNMGYEVLQKYESKDYGLKCTILKRNDFLIELVENKMSIAPKTIIPDYHQNTVIQGFSKFAFLVDDIEAAAIKLKGNGVNLRMDVTEDKKFNNKFILLDDNNGNTIQLIQKLN